MSPPAAANSLTPCSDAAEGPAPGWPGVISADAKAFGIALFERLVSVNPVARRLCKPIWFPTSLEHMIGDDGHVDADVVEHCVRNRELKFLR